MDPTKLTYGSNKKAFWICKNNKNHKWDATIKNRTIGRNCPYCSSYKVCKDNCLKTNFPDLCKEWDYKKNKDLRPENIATGSIKLIWWICSKGHEWKATIKNRTKGVNCHYCSGYKASKDNCLLSKFPEIAKTWHPTRNGELTPSNVLPKSSKSVWWICSKGHEWKTAVCNRSIGRGCHYCFKKNEGKVKTLLLKYFKDWVIVPGKKIWHTYKDYNHKRFCDFWLEKNNIKIITEYDGIQHFKPIRFNGISLETAQKKFKQTQIKDKLDIEFCKENNIILWRIKYDEDKEKSIKELLKKIEKL